jgi:hypothetical protein
MARSAPPVPSPLRYWRYVGLLALFILIGVTINTAITKPNGARGIDPGQRVAPFAVPLALGSVVGDADIAGHAGEGTRGKVAACSERGPQILNVCQLYERGPLVLALFVNAGGCQSIVGDLNQLAPSFPGVQFAAVALRGDRAGLRRLARSGGVRIPLGQDRDGSLLALYRVASCPQVTFAYPGGVVQSRALLVRPGLDTLRQRVRELVAASRARGWSGGTA